MKNIKLNAKEIVEEWTAKHLNLKVITEIHSIFGDPHLCIRIMSILNQEIRRAHFWNLTIFKTSKTLKESIKEILEYLQAEIIQAESEWKDNHYDIIGPGSHTE